MNILFSPCHYVYDESEGGSEPYWAFRIADSICQIYPNSMVITGRAQTKTTKSYRIHELQKNKLRLDMSMKNALLFNLQYFFSTVQELLHRPYSIVHHVLPFGIGSTFNLIALLGFTRTTPFVLGPIQSMLNYEHSDVDASDIRNFNRGTNSSISLPKIVFSFVNFLSFRTLAKASKIIVINSFTRDLLVGQGVSNEKIVIISPGVDSRRFAYIPYQDKQGSVLELISVSYLIERKAVDVILKALQLLLARSKNFRLRIVGDGPQLSLLKELVRDYGLSEHVVFEGFVKHEQVHEHYKRAHVFISMSRAEGFASVCLEAMSCGLAVVATKVGGFHDAVQDGYNGYLVDIDDHVVLANKLFTLIQNQDIIATFGKHSRAIVESNYDWDVAIIPRYLDVYRSLV